MIEVRDLVKNHDRLRVLDCVSLVVRCGEKDTSVCSVIAVVELTSRYQTLMVNHPRYMLRLGLVTALLYLLMSYPLSLVARRLERRRK
jgi:ABC-type amino acid transport system permease subunit